VSQVEEEVSRLEKLKSSKVKELVLKKRLELEEICWKTHLVLEAYTAAKYSTEAVASGKYQVEVCSKHYEYYCAGRSLESLKMSMPTRFKKCFHVAIMNKIDMFSCPCRSFNSLV
jgi:hypothetical protein